MMNPTHGPLVTMVGTSKRRFGAGKASVAHALLCVAVMIGVGTGSSTPAVNCDLVPGTDLSCIKWRSEFRNPDGGDDTAIDIAYGGGKVFVTGTGYYRYSPNDYDFETVAYDADTGEELWTATWNGAANGFDAGFAVAATSDGSVVIVTGMGLWAESFGYDAITIFYDGETGEELDWRRYTLGGAWSDHPRAIAMSPDESTVYVAIQSGYDDTLGDYATVAYDVQSHNQVWAKRFNGPGWRYDTPRDIAVSPDSSTVYVAGQTYMGPAQGYDYGLVAYDAADGTQKFVATYNGPSSTVENGWQVEVSPDGATVFVAGLSRTEVDQYNNHYDYATVAFDAVTGQQKWVHRYDNGDDDRARGLVVSPDGLTVYVAGESDGVAQRVQEDPVDVYVNPTGIDAAVVAIDATTGLERWVTRFDNLGGGEVFLPGVGPISAFSTDTGRELAISPGGAQLYLTGRSAGTAPPVQEGLVLSMDAVSGTPLWQARVHGDATYTYDGETTGIVVAPDGGVFATGSVFHQGDSFDYTTLSLRNLGDLGLPL